MNPTRLFLKDRKILLRVAEKSDYDKTLQFLRKHFYPYDTFGQGNSQCREDEEIEMQSIDSGTSVLAISDDSKMELVGVSLARDFREHDSRKLLKRLQNLSDQRGHPTDLDGLIFLEELKLRSEVCRRFGINEVLYTSLTCVREDFRKLTLSNILIDKTIECGAKLGFKFAFGLTLAEIPYIFMRSLQYQTFYSLKFVDYVNYRGIRVFSHFPPEAIANVAGKPIKIQ
ncbi:uncharacterized protein LOC129805761 [Phlebotomus papatasi]|uniref:uncharacterized protein LOC129805761 n=1 Tax=Phlebotomus papatasi TaxID=29031 RepID=UPI00248407B4|nr:uncharacterized protein LOC129805761 [Phlebotomus papatasi]